MTAEDSGYEGPSRDPAARARRWADEISEHPLDDTQAIDLAQVYAALAAVEQQKRIAAALESLNEFLALWSLSGSPLPSESTQKAPQEPQDAVSGTDEGTETE